MKILNLTDLEKSEIKYEISKFPDGQQQVQFKDLQIGLIKGYTNPRFIVPIQIKSRLNNFKDLEKIICATKSLRNLGVKEIHLYTPYFLGSRSDRKFEEGSNNYLKDVICPIINSLKFESVTVLDPHSDVLEACLNNFKKINNEGIIKLAFNMINPDKSFKESLNFENSILISPDAGANKKIFKIAEQIGYTGKIITCSKSRDVDGKLSRIKTNIGKHQWDKDFIIIDDICDGGRTFIELAKRIKAECPMEYVLPKIYLIVTHGIFSKGFKKLNQYFNGIYCTNSYADIENISHYMESKELSDNYKKICKQLNVF